MPKQRYNSIGDIANLSNNSNSYSANNDYDFSNIKNKPISEILKLIPDDAAKRFLIPSSYISAGFELTWRTSDHKFKVRFHSQDLSAPPGSNASIGWIVRIQRGSHYMDSTGVFHPPGIFKITSPHYSEHLCNDTHIPVENNLERNDYTL